MNLFSVFQLITIKNYNKKHYCPVKCECFLQLGYRTFFRCSAIGNMADCRKDQAQYAAGQHFVFAVKCLQHQSLLDFFYDFFKTIFGGEIEYMLL